MSVWKRIESKALDAGVKRDVLERALNEIGIGLDYKTKEIRNAYGKDMVDAALVNLQNKNKSKSMGIKFTKKGGVTLVGDIWGTGFGTDGKQEALLNKIAQAYQKTNVIETVEENGWTIENVTNVDGKVKIALYQL